MTDDLDLTLLDTPTDPSEDGPDEPDVPNDPIPTEDQ